MPLLSDSILVLSVQACAAYSFITIPSLGNIFSRLNLYLLSGQVALANQCLSQGESLFILYFWISPKSVFLSFFHTSLFYFHLQLTLF